MSYAVRDFLESVEKFNKAMDGPSGDAEISIACEMRDAAMAGFRETAKFDDQIGTLLHEFDKRETQEP